MDEIHLHIDRLILHGAELHAERHEEVRAALVSELARLLHERDLNGAIARGGAWSRFTAAVADLSRTTSPAELGCAIAHSIHGRIAQ
jgi:hypothetical protein